MVLSYQPVAVVVRSVAVAHNRCWLVSLSETTGRSIRVFIEHCRPCLRHICHRITTINKVSWTFQDATVACTPTDIKYRLLSGSFYLHYLLYVLFICIFCNRIILMAGYEGYYFLCDLILLFARPIYCWGYKTVYMLVVGRKSIQDGGMKQP